MLRTTLRGLLLVLSAAAAQTQETGSQETGVDLPPALTYRYGIHTRSADGVLRLQINGRAMYDVGSFDDDLDPAVLSGQEWRRVRLLIKGEIGEHLGFRAQWDFSDSKARLLDLYFDWRTFPLGVVRLGHFREPLGLESQTSPTYLTFLERSGPTDALTFGRNRGVQLSERTARTSWAVGVFREADAVFPDELGDNLAVTARGTWLPVWRDEGAQLVHLGLGLSYRDTSADPVTIRARPESHLLDRLVDTGPLHADHVHLAALEAAWVRGPFSLQAELSFANLEPQGGGQALMRGGYVQGSWFPTGEHRAYNSRRNSFGRIDVLHPVIGEGSHGAWELAARWSQTDLDDGDVAGGVMQNVTLGVNWYLTSLTRVMLNYIETDVDGSDVDGSMLMLRLQVAF
ncbi:MAG: porin [Planctomycetota bacterium]